MPVRARVIGYIPLEGHKVKTRMSKLIDVTRAKNDGDRLKKLGAAAKGFDHHDSNKHDCDVKAGAVAVVYSVLHSCSPFFIAKSREIRNCLRILLRLYRCSDERLRASFCTDGSLLLHLLLQLVEVNYRLGKKGDTKTLVLAQQVIDKLTAGAQVPLDMVVQHDGLLSSLVGNINGATGLMESIELGSTHMYEAVREESARILSSLSLETRNKSKIAQGHWLDAVLASARGSNVSKAYAIQTLGQLSSLPENKVTMIQHKHGIVLDVLLQAVSSRSAQIQVSINATKIIGNLSCQATASQIGSHPSLLVTLSSLACRNDKLAIAAAMTIKKLATYVRSKDSCHADLLQALLTMSYGRATEVLKWTVRAYYEQASFPHDRLNMIAHKGLLPSLTMLTQDKNCFVREHAQEVLSALAIDVANAKNMGVENVLRCVASNKLQHGLETSRDQFQPRSYSPSSVAQFDFDFDANF